MAKIKRNANAGYFEVQNKPTEVELKAYYEKEYYQKDRGSYAQKYPESELQFKENKIKLKASIAQNLMSNDQGKKILDVGCGEGFVLKYFNDQGWNIQGLDFSKFGCANHNPDIADQVIEGNIYENLDKLISKGEQYDLIWLDNVLEHVIDVERLLEVCKKLSKQDGILTITVPNDFSAMQMALLDQGKIEKDFWVKTPDHLSYFTAPSLRKQMELSGWNTKSIIADFPIDWFLTNEVANYIQDKSAGKPAHHSRVWLYNHIMNNNDIEAVVNFYESLANIGMGRNITGFFKIAN